MTERRDTRNSADDERPTVQELSVWSRLVSNGGTLIVTAAMVGGIWWWTVGVTQPKPNESPKAADDNPTEDDSQSRSIIGRSTNGDGKTEPVVRSTSTNGNSPANATEFDAARTSWQDPFNALYWESDGWTFQPEAMQSSASKPAIVRFRRDYKKISVECRVAPVGESGVFQIRLFAPATDALLQAEFSREMVKVSSTIKRKSVVIKQRRFPVAFVVGKPTLLRLKANGNRVLVICDGRTIINCSQPAEQSGKPLQFSLRTEGGVFRISSLRLEGD